jgi:phospholipase C
VKTVLRFAFGLCSALALGSCATNVTPAPQLPGGSGEASLRASARAGVSRASSTPIQHVVFIIQENRSFDNLFQGYPGANTAATGKDSKGRTIRLEPIPLEAPYDISHGFADFSNATDGGKMDGFDLELTEGNASNYRHPQYGFVPKRESRLYFAMAREYVLADNAFASHLDASYVAHQYAIAAQADAAVDLPPYFGCNHQKTNVIGTLTAQRTLGPTEATCRNYPTLGDELDAAGLPWRYYSFSKNDWLWAGYPSVDHIRYGPDWKTDLIGPETQVLKDIADGTLASVAWVTPSIPNSDHSSSGSNTGPEWVASVVNAIGTSQYWDSTAIFVIWDEWGGWYDHVPPPYEDYDGLGIRVPLLVISPYAKRGYVSHVQYEMSSVLRFTEDTFGLGQLAASDARANDPAVDCFDFTQKPRAFHAFKTSLRMADFARMDAAFPGRPDSE